MLFYVHRGLALNPTSFGNILDLIDPSRYDDRPDPERFTVREVIAHLADFEPVFRGRIERALKEDNPAVEIVDEDLRVTEGNYAGRGVDEWFLLYATERARTVDLIENLTPEQQQRTMTHPILGTISVFQKAALILGHDAYHLEQLSSLISLE